jgi:predicted glycogen debranching enzyme
MSFKKDYEALYKQENIETNGHEALLNCANTLITYHNGRKRIEAGYSWLHTGLLRETLVALPGLTLYAGRPEDFEEILDNLLEDNQERLFQRTTQVEAPLYLAETLQQYIAFGADEKLVWKKYGKTMKAILESYKPGVRKEVAMHPNGLIWAQMDGVALSWMNAYINGRAVTERAGYQVETNAFWYSAIRFACKMDKKYGNGRFAKDWTPIADLVKANFTQTFWNERLGFLADYVDNEGQHTEVRPNQLSALAVADSPVDEDRIQSVLRVVDNELVTARGIRSLSPRDVRYKGVYEGSQVERDLAYHNGCAWPTLLAPYVMLCFKVKGPAFWKKAEWLLEGFYQDLNKHGVGAFSELYDGDPPFEPHGAISSALTAAALLVCDNLMKVNKEEQK